MSAGARLMVMRVGGMSKPELRMAERTRRGLSRTGGIGQADGGGTRFLKDDAESRTSTSMMWRRCRKTAALRA